MSISYDLDISTSLEPQAAVRLIADDLSLERSQDNRFWGSGLLGGAIKTTKLNQEIIQEGFGFCPKLRIWFIPDTNSDEYEKGRSLMTKAAMAILRQELGDAVLLRQNEDIILQRINGKLILNSEWFALDNTKLSKPSDVSLAYEIKKLASPFL